MARKGSAILADDPLNRYRRNTDVADTKAARVRAQTVAPEWIGECLRLSGEAAIPALVLRQREGTKTALSYSYLTAVKLVPSTSVEIDFVGHAVSIRGHRLGPIFEALANQEAMEIAETNSEFDDESGAPFVETIAIVSTQDR
jgi:hypothetical protein